MNRLNERPVKRRTPFLRAALAVLLLCAVCLGICSCHGSRGLSPFVMPDSFDASRDYDIVFWAKNDTNKYQVQVYQQAIAGFEALYPNFKVELRLYTDYGKIYNDVITNIPTQTTPDVCVTYPDHIATYLTGANVVVPLDALMDDPGYGLGGSELRFATPSRSGIVPQFLNECLIDGHYWALPFMRSTEACYVNETMVEALGYTLPDTLTWDFVWEVSEAAAKKNADGTFAANGQKVMIPFIYKSTDNMMITQLRQKGAGYSDDTGGIAIFNDVTRSLLKTVAAHTASGAFSTFKFSGYPANFLNAGQCVFAVDSTAGSTWMGPDAPLSDISDDAKVSFECAVRAVPQYDASDPLMISQGPSLCVFNKSDPQRVLASWLFAQYLLTDGVQTAYAETEGYVPVTQTAQSSADYQSYLAASGTDNAAHYQVKIEASRLLLDNISNTFVTPVFNGSASLRAAASQLIEDTVKTEKRGGTVDDACIDDLYASVKSLYRLDQLSLRAGTSGGENADLGSLPAASLALLVSLCAAWLVLAAIAAVRARTKPGPRRG